MKALDFFADLSASAVVAHVAFVTWVEVETLTFSAALQILVLTLVALWLVGRSLFRFVGDAIAVPKELDQTLRQQAAAGRNGSYRFWTLLRAKLTLKQCFSLIGFSAVGIAGLLLFVRQATALS